MLRPESWLSKAQALPEGRRARVGHDCGPGTCMIVSHDAEGWRAYCFRCGESAFKPAPAPSLAERQARQAARRSADEAIRSDPVLPSPPNFDPRSWPLQERCWLYKAGLTNDQIMALGFYYHEPSERVILPVFEDGKLVYFQARSVTGVPKYLNPTIDRGSVVPKYGTSGPVVLTEDILSAVRVGQVAQGWCLLGVVLDTKVLYQLQQQDQPVLVWLDPDWDRPGRPGQAAAAEVCRTLALAGIPHANIISDKDPKLHSRAQITEYIQEALLRVRHHVTPSAEAPEGLQETGPLGESASL